MAKFWKRTLTFLLVTITGLGLILLLISGLNLSAVGLHRLLPQAPARVISLERSEEGMRVRIMDYLSPPIQALELDMP